jgi:coatomer subunit gamma
MTEISDEFKVIIVDAIRSLCLKFPSKHASMLTFLSGVLRDEGGYDFKRAVVEAIFDMIKFIGECKEQALSHLCEFIEDCEFTKLSIRILHLLGMEGPKSPQPAKYIRFIYNRVVLENATVRAAAVSSMAKFGVNAKDSTLRKSIGVLLNRLVLFVNLFLKIKVISVLEGVWMMSTMKCAIELHCISRCSKTSCWLIHT